MGFSEPGLAGRVAYLPVERSKSAQQKVAIATSSFVIVASLDLRRQWSMTLR
jgi:hypothetical protein